MDHGRMGAMEDGRKGAEKEKSTLQHKSLLARARGAHSGHTYPSSFSRSERGQKREVTSLLVVVVAALHPSFLF